MGSLAYTPCRRNYTHARIRVTGRTSYDAYHTARNVLDLQRALWNFSNNFNRITYFAGTRARPINKLIAGPIYTIHSEDGKLLDGTFWYDHLYYGPIAPDRLFIEKFVDRDNLRQWAKRQLNKCAYKEDLKESLLRYVRALDQPDSSSCFLLLWSILEYLTGAKRQTPHDQVIRRAAFIWNKPALHRDILYHLKEKRNEIAHQGIEFESSSFDIVYQLKDYVEKLIFFHLVNPRMFSSLDEGGEFMGLAYSQEALRKRVKMLGKALKFRQPKAKR